MEKICSECIEENFLKKHIDSEGELGKCSFCGNIKTVFCFNALLDIIEEGLRSEYDQPENGLGYVDGEWVDSSAPVKASYDLLSDLGLGGSRAFQDIHYHFSDLQWCPKEFYGLSTSDKLNYTWDSFKKHVMHNTRFFFLINGIDTGLHDDLYLLEQLFGEISSYIENCCFISEIPKGKEVYRGRFSSSNEKFKSVDDVGPPLETKANTQNRFSPAGIPMFYASEDAETCHDEFKGTSGILTIVKWRTIRNLHIIDFTKIFSYSDSKHYMFDFPSIFDSENRGFREILIFLRNLADDISKPIKKDGREHIEYIPTQIITEYFKIIHRFDGGKIDGICYYSSVNGKKNYVFFADIHNCRDDYLHKEQLLELDNDSIEYREVDTA